MPDTVIDTGCTAVSRMGKNPCPQGVCILDRLETVSRGMHSPLRLKQSKGGERKEPRVEGRWEPRVMRRGGGLASLPPGRF